MTSNNKIEKFKKQFSSVKTIKFKRGKKMDKKLILQIQLLIKSLFQDGELDDLELLDNSKLHLVKDNILEILETMIDKKGDKDILKEYEECILKYLQRSIRVIPPIYQDDEITKLENQIVGLKNMPQPEQRTPEWYTFRNNRLTASDLGTILGVNPYEKYNKVIQKKCGIETPFYMNENIRRGVKYEEVITMIYQLRNNLIVYEYGCLPHPDIPHFGASPDGIVDTGSENRDYIGRMLEIKCPGSRDITGFCPEYYYAQVQGQLEVCDLELCDFVECIIKDYDSRLEYFDDFFLDEEGKCDYTYSKSGLEKGIVIEGYDSLKGKPVFWYADLGINYEDSVLWETKIIDNEIMPCEHISYNKTTYWKATEYNELLIKREKEWFHNHCIPKINKFWEDVLHYRTRPTEEVMDLVKVNKRKNEPEKPLDNFIKTNTKESLFLSDSD